MWLLICFLALAAGKPLCGVTPEWERAHFARVHSARRLSSALYFKRSAVLAPIRITPYIADLSALPETVAQRLQTAVLPVVVKWFESILSVYRLLEPLRVGPSTCGDVSVPYEHQDPGVADSDFLLYVSAMDDAAASYAAAAAACDFDGGNSRHNPSVGVLYLNAAVYPPSGREIATIRHQLMHALGFSTQLFSMFTKPDGTVYEEAMIATVIRGRIALQLTTPKVVARARTAFGCTTLVGVELENGSTDASAHSHWEARALYDDFMTGEPHTWPVYSAISFAALEDSGWYAVDYTNTEENAFGKGRGCGFFDTKCVVGDTAQFPEFCTDPSWPYCDSSYVFKGQCSLTYAYPPLPYQYFSDPGLGGEDSLLDYCPIVTSLDEDCTGKYGSLAYVDSYTYGEEAGDSSRCFTGTYILSGYYLYLHNGCHRVDCIDGVAYVYVGDSSLACPVAGGDITFIPGFDGYITCAPYEVLCRTLPCSEDCFGMGTCVNGACQCEDGRTGKDCLETCPTGCKACLNASTCTVCIAQTAVLSFDQCICPDGSYMSEDGTSCHSCDPACSQCDSSYCYFCIPGAEQVDVFCECPYGQFPASDRSGCLPCGDTCETCESEGACTACKLLGAVIQSGVCACSTHSYLSQDASECVECSVECKTCNGEGVCTECSDENAVAVEGVCSCLDGFYFEQEKCTACDSACETCSGPGIANCVVCKSPGKEENGVRCACTAGSYFSSSSDSCLPCPPSCLSCRGEHQCTSCKSAIAVLADWKCACPSGFLMSVDGSECEECAPPCLTCSELSACLTCKATTALLEDGQCVCRPGFYLTTEGTDCLPCDSACKICSEGGQCMKCWADLANAGESGICVCSDGFFLSSSFRTCEPCHGSCQSCTSDGPLACILCKSPSASSSTGVCACEDGFYMSSDWSDCLACPVACKACTSDDNCTECQAETATISYGACICPLGAFISEDGLTCTDCDPQCESCSQSGYCDSCKSAHGVLTSDRQCECEDGFFLSEDTAECWACDAPCATCTGSGACDQCKSQTTTLIDGQCQCESGKHLTEDGTRCVDCHGSCESCSGAGVNECTECKSMDAVLTDGKCECMGGFFLSGDFASCLPCASVCLTCVGPTATQCTSCLAPKTLMRSAPGPCSPRRLEALAPGSVDIRLDTFLLLFACGGWATALGLYIGDRGKKKGNGTYSHFVFGLLARDDVLPRANRAAILTSTLLIEFYAYGSLSASQKILNSILLSLVPGLIATVCLLIITRIRCGKLLGVLLSLGISIWSARLIGEMAREMGATEQKSWAENCVVLLLIETLFCQSLIYYGRRHFR